MKLLMLIFVFNIFSIHYFIYNKLLILINIEILFSICFIFIFSYGTLMFNWNLLYMFFVFMVLDSCLGIMIFISSSRNTDVSMFKSL